MAAAGACCRVALLWRLHALAVSCSGGLVRPRGLQSGTSPAACSMRLVAWLCLLTRQWCMHMQGRVHGSAPVLAGWRPVLCFAGVLCTCTCTDRTAGQPVTAAYRSGAGSDLLCFQGVSFLHGTSAAAVDVRSRRVSGVRVTALLCGLCAVPLLACGSDVEVVLRCVPLGCVAEALLLLRLI